MLVTQDGYLLIKQWNFIPEDIEFFYSFSLGFRCLFMFLVIISSVISYLFFTSKWKWSMFSAAVASTLSGYLLGQIFFMGIFMLIIFKIAGFFNVFQFLFGCNVFCPGGCGGELKLVVRST